MIDPFNLERFVVAQAPLYERVIRIADRTEAQPLDVVHLPAGAGLGYSEMAQRLPFHR
jgi:uncharacterized protein (DUF1810 family)